MLTAIRALDGGALLVLSSSPNAHTMSGGPPPVQEALELIQAGGTLAFALLALGALITGRVVPKHVVDDRDQTVAYERAQKDKAYDLARASQASHDRLADAVEARNRLDEERLRRGGAV